MEIIPTILTDSSADLEKKLNFLQRKVNWVQIDILDGRFAPRRTFPLEWLDNYLEKDFWWDIHLMVKNPFSWVEKCNLVMAQRVIGQIEFMENQFAFLERVESEGMEGGLALDLATPLEKIDQGALLASSVILLLGVKAGKGGQKFEDQTIKKIRDLAQKREELKADFKIGVDGGIDQKVLKRIKEAGAEIAYIGQAVWSEKIKLPNLK